MFLKKLTFEWVNFRFNNSKEMSISFSSAVIVMEETFVVTSKWITNNHHNYKYYPRTYGIYEHPPLRLLSACYALICGFFTHLWLIKLIYTYFMCEYVNYRCIPDLDAFAWKRMKLELNWSWFGETNDQLGCKWSIGRLIGAIRCDSQVSGANSVV